MELIDLVNSVIFFLFSNNLNHMVNFPTQISDCDSYSLALLDLLLSFDLVFVIQWLSVHLETLIMLSQFPLAFPSNLKGDVSFHGAA